MCDAYIDRSNTLSVCENRTHVFMVDATLYRACDFYCHSTLYLWDNHLDFKISNREFNIHSTPHKTMFNVDINERTFVVTLFFKCSQTETAVQIHTTSHSYLYQVKFYGHPGDIRIQKPWLLSGKRENSFSVLRCLDILGPFHS